MSYRDAYHPPPFCRRTYFFSCNYFLLFMMACSGRIGEALILVRQEKCYPDHRCTIRFHPQSPGAPYPAPVQGSTLRGGFGAAFRRIVCVIRDKECSDCLLKGKCVYSCIFETPPPADTTVMRKYEAAPVPL